MLQFELETDECFDQSNGLFHEQVSTFASVYIVWFLLHYENQVSRQRVSVLVSLRVENNRMSMEGAFIKRYFECFGLIKYLLALTTFTFLSLLYNLAFTIAFVTGFLNLLVHARTHLVHLNDSSLAFASLASLDF